MKTVRVRIPLIVNSNGHWSAAGWEGETDENMFESAGMGMPDGETLLHESRYFIIAEVPIPVATEIKARGVIEKE